MEKDVDLRDFRSKSSCYETGWNREDRLILNLISTIRIEEDIEKKKEYQTMINEMIKPIEDYIK